jgi:segregation and condensation protein A
MRNLIGFAGEWTDISSYMPDGWHADPVRARSSTAATFAASLELAKEGCFIPYSETDIFAMSASNHNNQQLDESLLCYSV